jgi:ABC-type multidrug transport system ATPase subunit
MKENRGSNRRRQTGPIRHAGLPETPTILPGAVGLRQHRNWSGPKSFVYRQLEVINAGMPERAIDVQNLKKFFPPASSGWRAFLQPFVRPTKCALAGVTFSVEPGECVAIMGPNGAGKSTLFRILATLILPTDGRAAIHGFDVLSQAQDTRSQFGYHTGGDEGFYTRLTGRANLAFFAAMNNLDQAEIAERIAVVGERLGISDALDSQVRTYSTGMTHRLGLARAILHEPPVLLLDEPTRSLDPLAASDFRTLLKEDLVKRHGTTLLFSSHSAAEVEEIADRVVLLEKGRVAAFDTPSRICALAGAPTLEDAAPKLMRLFREREARA